MNHLNPTRNLKLNLLETLLKTGRINHVVRYNKTDDHLIVRFANSTTEEVAHYLSDHIALLYRVDTLEIVGIQIEDDQCLKQAS